ncbi:hypothetical protein K438DRAFT_1977331 [Mycena galopus ATCC 62051]|nr:hypothetical protein K438DRAFT_1977331 [Mycena galopus ATCC 62051]
MEESASLPSFSHVVRIGLEYRKLVLSEISLSRHFALCGPFAIQMGEKPFGTYRVGNYVYSTVYGDRRVVGDTPRPEKALPLDDTGKDSFPDFTIPRYIHTRHPYLMFIPKSVPWHGPLLRTLNWQEDKLPILYDNGGWTLHRDLVLNWRSLEDCLEAAAGAMLSLCEHLVVGPSTCRAWKTPVWYGYRGYHWSEKAARRAAWELRNAFLPLLGLVSMCIWCMQFYKVPDSKVGEVGTKRKANNPPNPTSKKIKPNSPMVQSSKQGEGKEDEDNSFLPWQERVIWQTKLERAWLDHFLESVAGNFMIERVGAFFEIGGGKRKPHLEWLLWSILQDGPPVPLYFSWGPLPSLSIDYAVYPQLLQIVPGREELDYLTKLPDEMAFSRWSWNESINVGKIPPAYPQTGPIDLVTAFLSSCFTDVATDVLDRPGERMEAFFARRNQENEVKLKRETPPQKASRVQLINDAKKGCALGRKGSRVFVWEKRDSCYIRRAAGHGNYKDYWMEYRRSMRRYDSFNNEWDLCSAFEDDGTDTPVSVPPHSTCKGSPLHYTL